MSAEPKNKESKLDDVLATLRSMQAAGHDVAYTKKYLDEQFSSLVFTVKEFTKKQDDLTDRLGIIEQKLSNLIAILHPAPAAASMAVIPPPLPKKMEINPAEGLPIPPSQKISPQRPPLMKEQPHEPSVKPLPSPPILEEKKLDTNLETLRNEMKAELLRLRKIMKGD